MTDTTDTDDTDDVQAMLDYLAAPFSLADVAKGLAGRDADTDIEELPGSPQRGRLCHILDNGGAVSSAGLANLIHGADAEGIVKAAALDEATQNVTHMVEQGVRRSEATHIVAEGAPEATAKDLVQSELDMAQATGYSVPHDFENDLSLLRLEAELYEPERNREERLRVWDEMLKYTLYKSDIRYTPTNSHETFTDTQERWEVSSAKCHNGHLRDVKRREALDDDSPNSWQFEGAEQTPVRRFFPGWDPLPDVEDFVFPEGSR